MKKIISLLTIAVLMAVLATAAFATEAPALEIADVEGAAGAEVVMNVAIVNNPGVTVGEFVVEFDETALELVSMKAVGGEDWDWDAQVNKKSGKVVFTAGTPTDDNGDFIENYTLTGDAVLLTLTLKVKDDVKPGKYEVNAVVDFIGDDDADFIVGETFTGYVVIPCTDHVWDEGTVKTPATCTEDGVMVYTCVYCAEEKEEAIPATGHAWGEWTETVAPSCGVVGTETRTCANCGETEEQEIAALEHNYEVTETVEATCFEDGKVVYTCSICGDTYEEVLPAAGAHKWNEGEVKTEATCCTDGVMLFTCEACGETKEEAIAANGEHTWNEGEVVTEATCCEDGLMLFTCVNGTATKEEAIPATGEHDLYFEAIDDQDHKIICRNSGKELGHEAHTFGEAIEDAENPGWKYQLCEKCGYKLLDEPGETGDHSMIAVVAATLSMMGIALVVSKKKEF